MRDTRSSRVRRVSMAAGLCLVATTLLTGYTSASVHTAMAPTVGAPWSDTKVLTRETTAADGTAVVDRRTVTVTADRTTELKGQQSVGISWTGAQPTSALDPNLPEGTTQEYPVVILQCRGATKDASGADLPADQQPRPESCWTSIPSARVGWGPRDTGRGGTTLDRAVWTHDKYASASDVADSVPDVGQWPARCLDAGVGSAQIAVRLVPFIAVNGKAFWPCGRDSVAPEQIVDTTTSPVAPQEVFAQTRTDGTGAVPFVVSTTAENQSLGCSTSAPCSIVVIPVMGISCAAQAVAPASPTPTATDVASPSATPMGTERDAMCNEGPQFAAGELGSANPPRSPALALEGQFWWSASNWRNRFVIPITIAPAANVCDILDSRTPVGFYGSELLTQAALQWAPAYCLSQDRFKFQAHGMPESTAYSNLRSGKTVAAFMTYPGSAQRNDPPVAYAPVAVTGFAVAYTIDLPGGGGQQFTQLRLSPRLLAKLLSASYLGMRPTGTVPVERKDLVGNPLTLALDPEFVQLNPQLKSVVPWVRDPNMAWATMISPSVPSDLMRALTGYIAADPEATAFLRGTPDPWGMTVNPAYQDIALPRNDWPLLDTWVAPSGELCASVVPLAWFNRVLAPVTSLNRIAQDVLHAAPESLDHFAGLNNPQSPCGVGRMVRQVYGQRHVLGLVTLADAQLYGLQTAELRTSGTGPDAVFVAPHEQSMAAAIETAAQSAPGQPYLIDPVELRSHAAAYPGTMAVNVVAPLTGLTASTAGDVAQLVRVATTDGQVTGPGFGQLADGYLPMRSTGPTAALFASAQVVAEAIRVQSGRLPGATPTPSPTPTATATPTTATATAKTGSAGAPVTAMMPPPTTPVASGAVPPATTTVVGAPAPAASTPPQAAVSPPTVAPRLTGLGAASLPTAMGIGALGLMGAPVLRRLSTRRPRP